MLEPREEQMANQRKWLESVPSSQNVHVVSTARLSNAPMNVAASSPQEQTVLVMQDDRARDRRVDQGDD
jgi:hypothetical protein